MLTRYLPNVRNVRKYSLENMYALMEFLGNPQDHLKVIHVAGTSGKTSTCYYVAGLLREAGFKVGLTVSPHVSSINERLQIDLVPLAEDVYCKSFTEFLSLVDKSRLQPSYFEFLVAFAYWEFFRQKVDYAVVEVGLGGLLDGTNVISSRDKICIITDIGLDHMDVLGNTLPEIAAQKAGIIQSHNAVFCHLQTDEIMTVIKNTVADKNSPLFIVANHRANQSSSDLPLFQQRNFSLAAATVEYALARDHHAALTPSQIQAASQTLIPARMEEHLVSNKVVILDGAHNPQKLQALRRSIEAKYPAKPIAALISFLDGRSFRLQSSLAELAKLTDNLIITAFKQAAQDLPHGPVDPNQLAAIARSYAFKHVRIDDDPVRAFKKLLSQPESLLLVTGSFYLMEDIRPLVLNK